MADNIIEEQVVQPTVEEQQQANAAELANLMAISLGTTPPPQANQGNEGGENNTQQTGGEGGEDGQQQAPVVPEFKFDVFKEKFGYEKPEDILVEIEALRAAKAVPPPTPEIKFENEQSKKLFEAIKGGKQKEAYAILAEQEKLELLTSSPVTKENAADIIKAGMQNKYKTLSPELIEHRYNKTFGIPKEPIQSSIETDDEYEERVAEWKEKVKDIEKERIIEANIILPELEAQKAKLVLPEIEQTVDEQYVQWKKSLDEEAATEAETLQAYKAFKSADLTFALDFIDEKNNVKTSFSWVPDAESFQNAQEMVIDAEKYYAKYKNSDGSPNRKQYLLDIYFAANKEKIIMEAMRQAKNATIKAKLPDNTTGGITRMIPQGTELSEIDKLMQQAGVTRS